VIGEKIRQTRISQKRSLADVARKAKISVATLSRIENDKQTLDLGMFLTLARVLGTTPGDLLGENRNAPDNGSLDPLVKKIAAFDAKERTRLWRELAAAHRQKAKTQRAETRQLGQQVEELVAQIEFMRDELESVRQRLRR
jgi:transcriptional regulator with XRE-family HTH domain